MSHRGAADAHTHALALPVLAERDAALAVFLQRSPPSGGGALAVLAERDAARIAARHCAIRTLQMYTPGTVQDHRAFVQQQTAVDSQAHELCALARSSSMLALVSTDVRRAVVGPPAGALPHPRMPFGRHHMLIKSSLQCLLEMMLRFGCGDDAINVREVVPPRRNPYLTTDYPRYLLLSLITAMHYYRSMMRNAGAHAFSFGAPKATLVVGDVLSVLDVVPQLAFPSDPGHRRLLQVQCDDITRLVHAYYDAGPDDATRRSLRDSKMLIVHLPIKDIEVPPLACT